jgi:hypothetical protein
MNEMLGHFKEWTVNLTAERLMSRVKTRVSSGKKRFNTSIYGKKNNDTEGIKR